MMRRTRVFLLLGVATAASSALRAQISEPQPPAGARLEAKYGPKLAAFDAMVRKQMAADHTTGLAIAFLDGEDVWARAFGLSDVEDGSPLKPDSSFRLASITKPMTAIAVLQLVENGKIDLDAEIQTYVPYFPRKPHPVTVRQLLGHLGGISHYKNPSAELHIKQHMNTKQAIAIFQDFDLVAEPGTRYSYTTYGFNLLGAAIESASGQSYGEYMREHVWAPAGMSDTRMDDPREIVPNRVRGYAWEGGKLVNSEFVDISSRFAGGGTRSTVLDLLKLAQAFMDGKLVSKATVEQMTRPMILRDRRYTDYGMGWGIDPQNGRFAFAHNGAQNETRTALFILPARHAAFAAATNYESGDLSWYMRALAAQILGERWDESGGSAAYLPGKVDRAEFQTLRDAFQFGLSAYERRGAPVTDDRQRLRQAFAYFDRCVDRRFLAEDLGAARKTCSDGLQPLAGEPITVVGSFMSQTLAGRGGAARLDGYHASGPTAFFADYIRAYRDTPSFPRQFRFDARFEKQVAKWNGDWARTFNAETLSPASTTAWGLDARRLSETFAGVSIYPNLAPDIGQTARQLSLQGDRERALEAARLAQELYPELAQPAVWLAAAELSSGDSGQARALLQKARGLEGGERFSGPRYLNGLAYDLAEIGRLDAAAALLRIATELHPGVANLYDSLGELELKAGHTDAALAAYKKAFELDPKLESSAKAIEQIEKKKP